MYDPLLNQTFNPTNKTAVDDPAWFSVGAEPIWVTNELNNGRSGVIMWVGGGSPIKWVRPSRYMPYDGRIGNRTKIDDLIKWFTDDENPINLGLLYFDEPDSHGHWYGPDSPEVTRMIGDLDKVVGYLLDRLNDSGLLSRMNIIITSDHGFTNTPEDRVIYLDEFIDSDSYFIASESPIATIWPHEGKLEEIYNNLTKGAAEGAKFDVYRKEDIAPHFHFTHHRRISPIVAVAHDTFSFADAHHKYNMKGNHGYDNRLQDMHPFFLAMGPSFKKNFSVDSFHLVDIYPLMCHLLNLHPAPNNGSLDIVSTLLVQSSTSNMTVSTYIVGIVIVACVAGLYSVATCYYHHYLRRGRKAYSNIGAEETETVTGNSDRSRATHDAGASREEESPKHESQAPLLAAYQDEDPW